MNYTRVVFVSVVLYITLLLINTNSLEKKMMYTLMKNAFEEYLYNMAVILYYMVIIYDLYPLPFLNACMHARTRHSPPREISRERAGDAKTGRRRGGSSLFDAYRPKPNVYVFCYHMHRLAPTGRLACSD